MTDISNKLHITEKSKENLENNSGKNEDLVKTFQHLPENPEAITRQAEAIKKQKEKEEKEMPRKKIKQKRKTEAIVELERLNMKTEENVAKINAIKFFENKILIGKTPWAYENMGWGKWVFQERTDRYYYNFTERKLEAKKQWLILPKKEDFEDTLQALPGGYNQRILWYLWLNILSIILWETKNGYCDGNEILFLDDKHGYLGSVSEYNIGHSRCFKFDEYRGKLVWDDKSYRYICRPLAKKS